MNDSIFRISLDIHEHGSQAVLKAKKTDTGRKLHISLRSGGTPYTIESDCYAVFKATKPDGSILYNACTIENNEIIYEFTEQTCTSVGRCRCEIALYGMDETLITSPRFVLLVDGTIYPDESVESSDEFSALTKLVGDTFEVAKTANEAAENANTAATGANVATGNANEASRVACEAAEEASLATRMADKATENAGLATANAIVAADSANTASENANIAAERANEATSKAKETVQNILENVTILPATVDSMNIRVDLNYPIKDGTELVFRSPVDCSQVTGLKVYYIGADGIAGSQEFAFADAHGNNVGDIDHLFAENVVVKVILSVTSGMAFIQNADTNSYLEGRFNLLADSIVNEASGSVITMTDSSNRKLKGLALYGKTTQDGTPTPTTPVPLVSTGSSGNIVATITGKNIFGGKALADKIYEVAPNTTINETAGTVKFSAGRISGKQIFSSFKPNTQYTFFLYGSVTVENYSNLAFRYTDGSISLINFDASSVGKSHLVICTSEADKTVKAIIGSEHNGTTTLYYEQCGLFEGVLTEKDFSPYIKEQTFTVPTPNGLHGIPVENATTVQSANYTDPNGQHWICDEIDLARGVYIKRTALVDMGTLNWSYTSTYKVFYVRPPDYNTTLRFCIMCDSYEVVSGSSDFKNGNKVIANYYEVNNNAVNVKDKDYTDVESFKNAVSGKMLLYVLNEPEETSLTEEELATYATLHTNKPNTVVFNDCGAGMSLEYVADTKTYIDNKFTELQNAILSAGANV